MVVCVGFVIVVKSVRVFIVGVCNCNGYVEGVGGVIFFDFVFFVVIILLGYE